MQLADLLAKPHQLAKDLTAETLSADFVHSVSFFIWRRLQLIRGLSADIRPTKTRYKCFISSMDVEVSIDKRPDTTRNCRTQRRCQLSVETHIVRTVIS
ncbi:hypothetical protein J6590_051166 [Homalodisca vitripennis]|nr:hypothetical protein J6590_051166 [Homalodisca vitripennis]